MNLFYVKNILNQKLSMNESKHCLGSLRKKNNSKILITEGRGIIYSAIISKIQNNQVTYDNLKVVHENEQETKIHIAIAPTKNKARFEWFLEKVTEIGVDVISPVICEYSERRTINSSRCEKILISAMKQSKKATLPILNNPISFQEIVTQETKNSYIAHCYNKTKKVFKSILLKANKPKNITLFIGPEGDFSEKEINFAEKSGLIPVELGEQRFRTETAGILGCYMINLLL